MILIADDSRFMRNILKQSLQKYGYNNFVEAKNGREAILLFKLLKPSVVLLDITMPEVDGLEALKEIKALNQDAKVIMCSAMATDANRKEALMLGAGDFVRKPFFEDLHVKVANLQAGNGGDEIESIIF